MSISIEDILNNCEQALLEYASKEEIDDKKPINSMSEHEKISRNVFRRLLLRYAQLDELHSAIDTKKLLSDTKNLDDKLKYAITDLFVEKALAYLEEPSKKYKKNGLFAYKIGIIVVIIGMIIAGIQLFYVPNTETEITIKDAHNTKQQHNDTTTQNSQNITETPAQMKLIVTEKHFCDKEIKKSVIVENQKLSDSQSMKFLIDNLEYNDKSSTIEYLKVFTKSFTFYGLLIMIAVGCWRYGKSMMDQSERLFEKRHALRQGRLFVHLKGEEMEIDEMIKAFDWNVSKNNAFTNMKTEAKAPIGELFNSLFQATISLKEAISDFKKGQNV